MKEFLVDYSLKDTNAAAIANLYEERLIQKLLSVQEAQQREKLSSKEEEIVIGKRVNRLCDLFYKAYGPMKEGKWPSCKEDVELRTLLAETPYDTNALNSAYSTFQLEEHDAASADFAPPNIHNADFWTAADAVDWISSNVMSGEEREDAQRKDETAERDHQKELPRLAADQEAKVRNQVVFTTHLNSSYYR
jgi:hypothetical protein